MLIDLEEKELSWKITDLVDKAERAMNLRDPEMTEWICDELDSLKKTHGLFEKQMLWSYLQQWIMTLENEMLLYGKILVIILRRNLITKNQWRVIDPRWTRDNDCSK